MSPSLRDPLDAPRLPVSSFDPEALGRAACLLPAGSLAEVSLRLHLTEHFLCRLGGSREVVTVLGDLIREITLETWSVGRSTSVEQACFEEAVGIGEDLGAVLALLAVLNRESSAEQGLETSLADPLLGWVGNLRALLAAMATALGAEPPVALDEPAWQRALGGPLGNERGLLRFPRPEDAERWVWRECFLQDYYPPLLQGIFRESGERLLQVMGPVALPPVERLRAAALDLGMGYQALALLAESLFRSVRSRAEDLLFEAVAGWCGELLALLQAMGEALGEVAE